MIDPKGLYSAVQTTLVDLWPLLSSRIDIGCVKRPDHGQHQIVLRLHERPTFQFSRRPNGLLAELFLCVNSFQGRNATAYGASDIPSEDIYVWHNHVTDARGYGLLTPATDISALLIEAFTLPTPSFLERALPRPSI